MKYTTNITVTCEKELASFETLLSERGFKHIGTRLWEDEKSYIRITIEEPETSIGGLFPQIF